MFIFFAVYKFSYIFLQSGDVSSLADVIKFFTELPEKDPRFDGLIEYLIFYTDTQALEQSDVSTIVKKGEQKE